MLQGQPRRIDSPYVFPGRFGGKLTDIKVGFEAARTAADLYDVRFHDLRHTFASHLVMEGVGLETVAELLGHSKKTGLQITKRYAHLSQEHRSKAVEKLGGLTDKINTHKKKTAS
jgi:integrase